MKGVECKTAAPFCKGGSTKKEARDRWTAAGLSQSGDYLLSHFRSIIGVARLNFSVRNGKRWNPRAIITLMLSQQCTILNA